MNILDLDSMSAAKWGSYLGTCQGCGGGVGIECLTTEREDPGSIPGEGEFSKHEKELY